MNWAVFGMRASGASLVSHVTMLRRMLLDQSGAIYSESVPCTIAYITWGPDVVIE